MTKTPGSGRGLCNNEIYAISEESVQNWGSRFSYARFLSRLFVEDAKLITQIGRVKGSWITNEPGIEAKPRHIKIDNHVFDPNPNPAQV